MSAPVTVAIIRDTALLTNEQVASWCGAVRVAVQTFARYWVDLNVIFVPPNGAIPTGAYQLWLRDHTTEEGALGFHDDNGLPVSHVFVADDLANGTLWTATASHELWEMLANPRIDKFVEATIDGVTWKMPIEVADCCEDDAFAWDVTGTDGVTHKISAFALPSWFDPNGQAPFTYPAIDQITAPFMLADGGYIGRMEVAPTPGAWSQFMAAREGPRQVKKHTSRTMRLFRGEV